MAGGIAIEKIYKDKFFSKDKKILVPSVFYSYDDAETFNFFSGDNGFYV